MPTRALPSVPSRTKYGGGGLIETSIGLEKNEQNHQDILFSGLSIQLVRLRPVGAAEAGMAQRRSGLAASGGRLWAAVGGISRHRAFILIVRRYGPETLSPWPKQVLVD